MSEELFWLDHRVEELHAAGQQARWQLEELGEHRRDLLPVWDDACATEVTRRFLDPLTDDADAALVELNVQTTNLRAATLRLRDGNAEAENAARAANEVSRLTAEAGTIFRSVDSVLNEAVSQADQASNHARQAAALVAQAASVGA